ncbi:hypothetical protein AB0B01_26225 [Streptomyces sp. NPDC044571]|uniref:hypothetical protein n=1 Tax=Streptomyces sp. NPDC044571 TaxID=3155371 RepID=UPI0033FB1024
MSAGTRRQAEEGRAAAAALLQGDRRGAGLPSHAAPAAWTAFDQEVRRIHSSTHGEPFGSGAAAVRLCHPDGRIRAAALNTPRPPLALVAIRCTDWVPAVRERARQVLGEALAADPARTVVRLTPLVLHLSGREQGGWARERFEAALRADEPVLAWLRRCDDVPTRRFAVGITLDAGRFGVQELARRAANEPDPVTARLWTQAALRALATDGPDDAAVDTLLGARGTWVRAAGVTALRGADRAAEAVDYLADRSGTVRACARWLTRQDGSDPHPHCLGLVADPARVGPYAVAGLAEHGSRADVPLLRTLLDHPRDAVRAAALAGIRQLDASLEDELLLALLEDPSPSVAREASLGLRPVAGRLDPARLGTLIAAERPAHVRRAAFRLLRARGGIDELRASVALLVDADPALRQLAEAGVRGWNWQLTRFEGQSTTEELDVLLKQSAYLFTDYEEALRRSRLGLRS